MPEPVASGPQPIFQLGPERMPRIAAAFALTTIGISFLLKGKEEQSLRLMILGALLAMAGLFCL